MNPNPQATNLGYGDILRFSQLALERFGLIFSDARHSEMEYGIKRAFAASTCRDMDEYYNLLLDPINGAVELERLVNSLTINETHFFRDAAQLDALYNRVLPDMIEGRRFIRTLRIWSAGCSTGEEPYSIAMMLRSLLPDVDDWSITILGTDINSQALEKARLGLYTDSSFREERAKKWQNRFFTRKENRYELLPEVRRMVSFKQLNLADASYPSYETNTMLMDLIVCRNVTIYFDEIHTRKIIAKFHSSLVEGGWLVVGHAEHALGTYQQFQIHNFPDAILYQRVAHPDNRNVDWKQLENMLSQNAQKAKTDTARSPLRPLHPTVKSMSDKEKKAAMEQITELFENGEIDRALDHLLTLEKSDHENPELCTLLGKTYADMGNWQNAEVWCRKAIQYNMLNREAHYILALVYQHQAHIQEAIITMKKVIYIDSNYALGYVGLADLYRSDNQMPQALKALDNARKLLSAGHADEIVPGSGDISKQVLLSLVVRRQQQWSAETLLV